MSSKQSKNGGLNIQEYTGNPPPPQIIRWSPEAGKFYVKKSEVWAIDFSESKAHVMVHVREQVFKVTPESLIFMDGE